MTSEPALPATPATIFLRHPAHFLSFGAGSGLSPLGPGTAGTLWAWMSFVVMDFLFKPWLIWSIILMALLLGAWACSITGRALGQPDHSAMVIDEIVAFWLILAFLPRQTDSGPVMGPEGLIAAPDFLWLSLWAFVLFRIFDIAKPPPIRWVDQQFKSGWGVMADDLVAAGFTLLVLSLLLRLGVL